DAGLPRAERELAAAATSRFNGCLYCASVHARHAATYSKREADVQHLLDAGVTADLGERWNAIVAASVALTATPSTFAPEHAGRPVGIRRSIEVVEDSTGPLDSTAGRGRMASAGGATAGCERIDRVGNDLGTSRARRSSGTRCSGVSFSATGANLSVTGNASR